MIDIHRSMPRPVIFTTPANSMSSIMMDPGVVDAFANSSYGAMA